MQNSAVTIQCSNPNCQAANSLESKFCHKCGTPVVRRYLRAIGDSIKDYGVGELIEQRYCLKQPQILLDTKPGIPPRSPEEIPPLFRPYLQLFPYRLHLPQVYGYLSSPDDQGNLEIWLLEYGVVPLDSQGELVYPQLLPQLIQVWPEATALRQLNWLWQIASLWQPLQNKGLTSSLLNPAFLRVNGNLIQLWELQSNLNQVPPLKQLGKLWSPLIANAAASLKDFLSQLCQSLEQGKITRIEQLLDVLHQGIAQCGRSQKRTYEIFTGTDTGTVREHNEDACYPNPGEFLQVDAGENALAIVCDGVGGQDGGEIASQMAIETLVEEFKQFSWQIDEANWQNNVSMIENAIAVTNDRISQRNDSENRQNRQRMGTTLVISCSHAHEMYVANVGDSRVYCITPTSFYQVTVDDDLASREVRLGYLLYREAIRYPNAGALVQVLGMSASNSLQPTVQRLILDGDCVFLLCSDGLSDYDRVEQYWDSEILPILTGETDIATAGKRLLEIANQQNGHDNVTVALVACQVIPEEVENAIAFSFPDLTTAATVSANREELEDTFSDEPNLEESTELLAAPESPSAKARTSPWLLALLGLFSLGGLAYGVWYYTRSPIPESEPLPSPSVLISPSPIPESSVTPASPNPKTPIVTPTE